MQDLPLKISSKATFLIMWEKPFLTNSRYFHLSEYKLIQSVYDSAPCMKDYTCRIKVSNLDFLLFRSDQSSVSELYSHLLLQLKRPHSEIRLSAFQVADQIFQRSHLFRQCLVIFVGHLILRFKENFRRNFSINICENLVEIWHFFHIFKKSLRIILGVQDLVVLLVYVGCLKLMKHLSG